jgi:hypothetical protein
MLEQMQDNHFAWPRFRAPDNGQHERLSQFPERRETKWRQTKATSRNSSDQSLAHHGRRGSRHAGRFSWLFLLPSNLRGLENPYIGLFVFFTVPIVFFVGLILIPIGIVLARRRVAAGFAPPDRAVAFRRAGIFFAE